ncbi:MAG TPA: glycosyltransferase [Vicinamibacteria bacterium]
MGTAPAARRLTRDARIRIAERWIGAFAAAAVTAITAYVSVRIWTVISGHYPLADRLIGVLLLGADLFLCVHSLGFMTSVVKARRQVPPPLFGRHSTTPVAVIVASFNESAEVLEPTIASVMAMDYPVMRVYLLDDSTRPECYEGTARLAEKYGITLVHRTNRVGYKAGALNDLIPRLSEPYIAVLDADQRPGEGWLKEVIPCLEQDPRVAFVQLPQVYINSEFRVARVTAYQQGPFYEYIGEGKSPSNAMFCCGSNVVLRRSALLSVGCDIDGRHQLFDETSVTEDFATSLKLHVAGWRSVYLNRRLVVGMGPETLPAYFTQHTRWARGTLGVGLKALRLFLRRPSALTPGQWWEYFLSCSYYLMGLVNLAFILAPITCIAFGVRPVWGHGLIYLLIYLPYVGFALQFFLLSMSSRGYPRHGMWLATALTFATFWIYIKAAGVAFFGLKRGFGVTPKGVGGSIPVLSMPVELAMCVASITAAVVGLVEFVFVDSDIGHLVNVLWAGYQGATLSMLFLYFNRPVTIVEPVSLFERARLMQRAPVRRAAALPEAPALSAR